MAEQGLVSLDDSKRAVALGVLKKCYDESVKRRTEDIRIPNPIPQFGYIENPWPLYEKMYYGDQWTYLMQPRSTWKSMPSTNKVFQCIEAYTTFLTDNRPSIEVLPVEPFDYDLAETVKQGVYRWWELENMDLKTARIVKHSRLYGLGWFYLTYDAKKKMPSCKVVPPQCILVDPDVTVDNYEDITYLIYRYKTQVGEVKDKYPSIDYTTFDPRWTADKGFTNNETARQSTLDFAAKNPAQSCWVYQLWIKDTSKIEWEEETDTEIIRVRGQKFPKGRVITFAGGQVLDDRANPYDHGEFPFTPVHAYPSPGKWYGPSDVTHIVGPQITRNRMSQLIIDQTVRSGGAMIIVGAAAELNVKKITNAPVQILPAKDPSAIRIETFPAPSRHIVDYILMIDKDIDDLMGYHELSKGSMQPGNKTAAEIEAAVESDKTRVRMASRNLTWAITRVGRQLLSVMAQKGGFEWMVRISSKHDPDTMKPLVPPGMEADERYGNFTNVPFNQGTLRKKDEDGELTKEMIDLDLSVQDSSTLPNQQSERRQLAFQLFSMQVIDDQALLEILNLPGFQGVLQRKKEQRAQDMQMMQMMQQQQQMGGGAGMVPPSGPPQAELPASNGASSPLPPGAVPGVEGPPAEMEEDEDEVPPEVLMQILAMGERSG